MQSRRPIAACMSSATVTAVRGGSTRLASGTAASANPKPVKPRSSEAKTTADVAHAHWPVER